MELPQEKPKDDAASKEQNAANPPAVEEEQLETIIASLRESFESEETIRAKVILLRDKAADDLRLAQRLLSAVHIDQDIDAAAAKVEAVLPSVGKTLAAVESAVPPQDYFRHVEMWRRSLQDSVRVCVVVRFIRANELANVDTVRNLLAASSLQLPLDDYLVGVIGAISELARLCMTRATASDFKTPPQCASFASSVFEGFKLLNFRNDFLRKRFDGMKYDVKRIEEIMYDLAVRGLLEKKTDDAGTTKASAADVDMEESQDVAPAQSIK